MTISATTQEHSTDATPRRRKRVAAGIALLGALVPVLAGPGPGAAAAAASEETVATPGAIDRPSPADANPVDTIATPGALDVPAPATADAVPGVPRTYAPHLNRMIQPTHARSRGWQPATWYGPGLWGNRTACGNQLQPSTFGIAHRTLPCGTLVGLSYRGRRIAVRVIDRGPFSGASIDLTRRTSDYLRFTRRGTGSVHMSVISRYRL